MSDHSLYENMRKNLILRPKKFQVKLEVLCQRLNTLIGLYGNGNWQLMWYKSKREIKLTNMTYKKNNSLSTSILNIPTMRKNQE